MLQFGLVIPVLNERDNVAPLLARLNAALSSFRWEAIFVDDGSTDGTLDVILALARRNTSIRLIQRIDRKGLSTAVVEGILSTAAPVVGVIDGDMQHDEAILPAMIACIESGGAQVAVGSRYTEGGGTTDWDERRLQASKLATWLGNKVIGTGLSDPMSGYFVTERSLVVALQPRLSGIGFKILIDLLASSKQTLRVQEFAYHFRGRVSGESKLGSAVVIEYLMMLLDKSFGRILPARVAMFLMVGAMGLGVHLSVLRLSIAAGLDFSIGQSLAVATAILFNFTLNNLLTYRDRQLKGWSFAKGLVSFALVCSVGAVANVGVGTAVFKMDQSWWLAGIAGSVIGAVWNYAASSFVTWRKK